MIERAECDPRADATLGESSAATEGGPALFVAGEVRRRRARGRSVGPTRVPSEEERVHCRRAADGVVTGNARTVASDRSMFDDSYASALRRACRYVPIADVGAEPLQCGAEGLDPLGRRPTNRASSLHNRRKASNCVRCPNVSSRHIAKSRWRRVGVAPGRAWPAAAGAATAGPVLTASVPSARRDGLCRVARCGTARLCHVVIAHHSCRPTTRPFETRSACGKRCPTPEETAFAKASRSRKCRVVTCRTTSTQPRPKPLRLRIHCHCDTELDTSAQPGP